MRIAPQVELDADQRSRLEAIVRSRKLPVRLIERSRIVLLAAAGCRNKQITAELNLTPEKAARWRKRYLQLGLAGLEKDAPRPGRKPRITAKLVRELIAKTTQQTPPNATHWSTRSMAAAMGISAASVRRIWRAHGLKPHRTATFKLSNDPRFAEKLEDVVGLYLNPPEHGQGQIPGGVRSGQLLDKTPAQPRRDLAQLDLLLLVPSQKTPHGTGIGAAGVGVGDLGRRCH